jgi:DNA transformation protein
MGQLQDLPNIGPKLERQLHEAGIDTPEELKRVGSREAWLRILSHDTSACLMRLSALEGAISGVRWHSLDDAVKAELKAFYHKYKIRPARWPKTGKNRGPGAYASMTHKGGFYEEN